MSPQTTKAEAMREGGKKLSRVKSALINFAKAGKTFKEIEKKAQDLIKAEGAVPNFSLVPGYSWATCIMKNDALCHGIPTNQTIEAGDLITIDVGLLWKSYNLDTSMTFAVGKVSPKIEAFLKVGQKSLAKAISKVKPGASIYEISKAMQKIVERAGYQAVTQLTGHGIGKKLHEEPSIPCVAQRSDKKVKLELGQTLAIEIMYSVGNSHLVLDKDKWTYRTEDGSLTGMFEETVLVVEQGFEVLTG